MYKWAGKRRARRGPEEDEPVTRSEPDTDPDGASAALGAAILRVSATLDAVLREVVENARALTGVRRGAIAIVDEAGVPTATTSPAWPQGKNPSCSLGPTAPGSSITCAVFRGRCGSSAFPHERDNVCIVTGTTWNAGTPSRRPPAATAAQAAEPDGHSADAGDLAA